MKKNIKRIAIGAIAVAPIIASIIIISLYQRDKNERPSLADTRSIQASIMGFTNAKDLAERMSYVSKSAHPQKQMRVYVLVPFQDREIIDDEINLTEFSPAANGAKNVAIVEQNLTYLSGKNRSSHKVQAKYVLEKHGKKWLITDFQPTIASQK